MSNNEIIILILLLLGTIFYVLKKNKLNNVKTSYVKKEELVYSYEKKVMDFNKSTYSKEEKIEFMKKIHKDLHNNIFFTDDETKNLMLKLSTL